MTIAGPKTASVALLDHRDVDWSRVRRTVYSIEQHFHYRYSGPIRDLDHRLVVVPGRRHGDQQRVTYRITVSSRDAERLHRLDQFANQVVRFRVPYVAESIDFVTRVVVERVRERGPHRVAPACLTDRRLLEPSQLTEPDDALRTAAADLRETGATGVDLAAEISDWVHAAMTYDDSATDVRTTAAQALELRRGVCQDYAHVMLALCRLCELPARYVSGHLLGEGGTHAWVEVVVAPSATGGAVAHPFDPTHGRRPDWTYLTVAVGRDYFDVAPTSGSFSASHAGRLSAHKNVGVTAVEYAAVA